ncbi:phage capsid protein [Cytophagaceae bacterium DM2B3-1]|uniref:Phage capsid protein n=1 Tax=Xanthocytophaga flava TaxID=3048013 RepID=A0ABT7CK94_9BACT|nr:phage capsid protein [Xanthocytophaga flavus]MDJ1494164.1 phage capsid protein [Xanthocytophaga flavus]
MAIQKELWVNYIMGNLFKENPHLNPIACTRVDENVLAGKIVHIPQAGSKPNVVRNRGVFPAVAVRRSDGDIVYVIDEYSTDPTVIPNADTIELSYDKLDSVLSEHLDVIAELIGDDIIFNWLSAFAAGQGSQAVSAANVIRIQNAATTAATAPSATGNRQKFSYNDIRRAQTFLNKQNIAKKDRFMLLPSELMSQLQDDADLIKRDFAKELDIENGIITKLFGFNLMERSSTAVYDNAGTPVVKAVGAAAAATDNEAAVFWQKAAVEAALGEVTMFEQLNDPTQYGDVYSALVRMGGRKRRSTAYGVGALVQQP